MAFDDKKRYRNIKDARTDELENIEKIVNRTEFRVVECDGKFSYEIVPHKTPIDFTCSIETSAQGGPMILPELKLEEEFFVVKRGDKVVRESASVLEMLVAKFP